MATRPARSSVADPAAATSAAAGGPGGGAAAGAGHPSGAPRPAPKTTTIVVGGGKPAASAAPAPAPTAAQNASGEDPLEAEISTRIKLVSELLNASFLPDIIQDAVKTILQQDTLPDNPHLALDDAIIQEQTKMVVQSLRVETAPDAYTKPIAVLAEAATLCTQKGNNEYFGMAHMLQCIDVERLKPVRDAVMSIDHLFEDSSVTVGEHTIRTLTAFVGPTALFCQPYDYLSELQLAYEFIVTGPVLERAIVQFAKQIIKQTLAISKSGLAAVWGVGIAQPTSNEGLIGPCTMWTLSMFREHLNRFTTEVKAAIVDRRRIFLFADCLVFRDSPIARVIPVRIQMTMHYKEEGKPPASFAAVPAGSLYNGIFLSKECALAYRTLWKELDVNGAAVEPLRRLLYLDLLNSASLGNIQQATGVLQQLVTLCQWKWLPPTLAAFRLSRGNWLYNLANTAAALDRIIRLLHMPVAEGVEDPMIDNINRAEFGAVVPLQFARFVDEVWRCLQLNASPVMIKVDEGGVPMSAKGFAVAPAIAADDEDDTTSVARSNVTGGHAREAPLDEFKNAQDLLEPQLAGTKALWVLDVDNAWHPPALIAGIRARMRWLVSLCEMPQSRMLLQDPVLCLRLRSLGRMLRVLATQTSTAVLATCEDVLPSPPPPPPPTKKGVVVKPEVSTYHMALEHARAAIGTGEGKIDMPWTDDFTTITRKSMRLDVAAQAKLNSSQHRFPPEYSQDATRMQYVIDTRLDEALDDVFRCLFEAVPIPTTPFPLVIHRLLGWGLRQTICTRPESALLDDIRVAGRRGLANRATRTYLSRSSDAFTVYGSKQAMEGITPRDIWQDCLSVPMAFHVPSLPQASGYSLSSCFSVVAWPENMFSKVRPARSMEIVETVLVEGPVLDTAVYTFSRYVVATAVSYLKGTAGTILSTLSGFSPEAPLVKVLTQKAAAAPPTVAHMLLALCLGTGWSAPQAPAMFAADRPARGSQWTEAQMVDPDVDGATSAFSLMHFADTLPPHMLHAGGVGRSDTSAAIRQRHQLYDRLTGPQLTTEQEQALAVNKVVTTVQLKMPITLQVLVDTLAGYVLLTRHIRMVFVESQGDSVMPMFTEIPAAPALQIYLDKMHAVKAMTHETSIHDAGSEAHVSARLSLRRSAVYAMVRGRTVLAYQYLGALAKLTRQPGLLAASYRMMQSDGAELSRLRQHLVTLRATMRAIAENVGIQRRLPPNRLLEEFRAFANMLSSIVDLDSLHTRLLVPYMRSLVTVANRMLTAASESPETLNALLVMPGSTELTGNRIFGVSPFVVAGGSISGGATPNVAGLDNLLNELDAVLDYASGMCSHALMMHDEGVIEAIKAWAVQYVPSGILST